MRKSPSVAIVIPHYKNTLTLEENISLQAWNKFLSHYDTYTVSPSGIAPPDPQITPKYFDSHYFSSVSTYSQLLLSTEFYEAFNKYEYILIYQLDALVFSDQLSFWCSKNLSYIGAPWFQSLIGTLTSPSGKLQGGNGGLSLRRIPDFLSILDKVEKSKTPVIRVPHRGKWVADTKTYPFNEDGFWSFEALKYDENFTVVSQSESLAFAFETYPEKCFEMNGEKLPFGCHAWEKYNKSFWLPKIASFIS